MIRLFTALKIPEDVRDKIIELRTKAAQVSNDYRWEAKEKIHLTLKFIGDVKDALLPGITDEINFVKNYSSFNCKISKFGFFFRGSDANILWCNLETNESINDLVSELNKRMDKFNIEVDKRKFKGHLTLLRIKNKVDEKFISRFNQFTFEPIQFRANEIALIRSYLKPGGSEYKVLKIYELK